MNCPNMRPSSIYPHQNRETFYDSNWCDSEGYPLNGVQYLNYDHNENGVGGYQQQVTSVPVDAVKPVTSCQSIGLPCQTKNDWDYDLCYSYYANGCYNTCQFVNMGDIEDFMNNEKRKEKSRDAARCRRSKETEIFTDLAKALPLLQEQTSQLDKASIMRLAISYLRVRDMIKLVPEVIEEKKLVDDSVFLKSLEGFLIVLSGEGDFIYLSENVSDYLGITQIDLMGQNAYEYSHPCDHDEIREILSSRSQEDSDTPKDFFIRFKCTLTSKGRSVNLKSATYKVIHCSGHMLQMLDAEKDKDENKCSLQRCLVAIGQPIPHPSNIEAPLPRQTFLTKHSLDMKFTHAEDNILNEILGYTPEDLVGKSVYDYHHAMDSDAICSAFKCLFSKGQSEMRYRFLAKTGGYVWVLTQATLIYDKMQKPQSVVCVNYVISGVECKDEIYSEAQLSFVNAKEKFNCNAPKIVLSSDSGEVIDSESKSETNVAAGASAEKFLVVEAPPQPPRPQAATSKIIAPRAKEMNKGFLTETQEEPGRTMLKDEPDDLTLNHLAPVYAPFDENPSFSDMLDDFLLRDNTICPVLDEPSDPFISYRDSWDPSPQLLSPNMSRSSECSLPSLNSPSDSLGDEEHMSTFMSLQMDDDPELGITAPYVAMNTCDDLPLVMTHDIMWNSNDKKSNVENGSSLAQLLRSSVNNQLKENDHGGGGDGGGISPTESGLLDDFYGDKNFPSWNLNTSKPSQNRQNRSEKSPNITSKRSNTSNYELSTSKRTRTEPKEKMSSELLHQLISNNHNRGRPKGKSNWLLDSGLQKAACISQPSDSVLMNLLVSGFDIRAGYICLAPTKSKT